MPAIDQNVVRSDIYEFLRSRMGNRTPRQVSLEAGLSEQYLTFVFNAEIATKSENPITRFYMPNSVKTETWSKLGRVLGFEISDIFQHANESKEPNNIPCEVNTVHWQPANCFDTKVKEMMSDLIADARSVISASEMVSAFCVSKQFHEIRFRHYLSSQPYFDDETKERMIEGYEAWRQVGYTKSKACGGVTTNVTPSYQFSSIKTSEFVFESTIHRLNEIAENNKVLCADKNQWLDFRCKVGKQLGIWTWSKISVIGEEFVAVWSSPENWIYAFDKAENKKYRQVLNQLLPDSSTKKTIENIKKLVHSGRR